MNSKFSREILKKQLQECMRQTDLGFSVGLIDENDIYKWTVCFTGPEDTIYEGDSLKQFLLSQKTFLKILQK